MIKTASMNTTPQLHGHQDHPKLIIKDVQFQLLPLLLLGLLPLRNSQMRITLTHTYKC